MPKMEGTWVEGAVDRIDSRGDETLWIVHIETKSGKGFMPQLKNNGTGIGWCSGPEFFGTDDSWYKAALAYGRVMLSNRTS